MSEIRDLPHFLLGQSMGGAVALKVHLKQQEEWDGVLLVAPMCKVFLKVFMKLIKFGDEINTSIPYILWAISCILSSAH
jgi:alpha-beta hydrolase superfamily lysophospholipase